MKVIIAAILIILLAVSGACVVYLNADLFNSEKDKYEGGELVIGSGAVYSLGDEDLPSDYYYEGIVDFGTKKHSSSSHDDDDCVVTGPENTIPACTDGVDNDCDGYIDAEDSSCVNIAVVSFEPTIAGDVNEGDTAHYHVIIENRGFVPIPAGKILWNFLPYGEGGVVQTGSVNLEIGVGKTQDIFQSFTYYSSGQYSAEFNAELQNMEEFNLDDNSMTYLIDVADKTPSSTDVEVISFTMINLLHNGETPEIGDRLRFKAEIKNSGSVDVHDMKARFDFGDGSAPTKITIPGTTSSGSSAIIESEYTYTSEGVYEASILADYNDEFDEFDEKNNEMTMSVNVLGQDACIPGGPENTIPACTDGVDNDCDGYIDAEDSECYIKDVSVLSFEKTAPSNPEPGDNVFFKMIIKNSGLATLNAGTVSWRIDYGDGTQEEWFVELDLFNEESGSKFTHEIQRFHKYAASGTYEPIAIVDYGHTISESNEENNEQSFVLII